jgi:autotransporter family porin
MRRLRAAVLFLSVAVAVTACGTDPRSDAEPAVSASTPTAQPSAGPSIGPSAGPSATPGQSASASPKPKPPAAPAHFKTLPPGSKLPSEAQCATWVRAHPYKENKHSNAKANATAGQRVDGSLFSGDSAAAASKIAPRITGNFTGTTQTILRWTACKWGIDEDIVYAQTAIESWWRQDTLGDWGTDASACPPGHGLGADGKAGQCPQSYGVLQDRWPYMKQGWPGYAKSTAMAADIAYGIWRVCFEGYETWLNTVERGQTYKAGDAWGCVGRWFSGRWHTSDSDGYVARVKGYLSQRIWMTPDFQQ